MENQQRFSSDEPQPLPTFELKVKVTPVGFVQRNMLFQNGEYSVGVQDTTGDFTSGGSSNGPDLPEVVTRHITAVLEMIARSG